MKLPAGQGGFALGHLPPEGTGWLELVASGLAFDLSGLTPASPGLVPAISHRFGLDDSAGVPVAGQEAITLVPGEHLAGGQALLPVVRVMLGLALRLAELPGVLSIAWHPAGSLIGPGLFRRQVEGWLVGGAFPALGLTALVREPDGALVSQGLAFFIGQELRIDPAVDGGSPTAARIAVRLIHRLVEQGPLLSPLDLEGQDGQRLLAEPTDGGRVVRVGQRQSAA